MPEKKEACPTTDDLARRIETLEAALAAKLPTIEPAYLYTIPEAATLLRCQRSNVYGLVRNDEIATISVGAGRKGFRLRGADIIAFLDARRTGGPKPVFAPAIKIPKAMQGMRL